MKEWFWAHLPEGLLLAGITLLRWFGVREMGRMENDRKALADMQTALDVRVRDLETDRVTRADFDELRHSLTATIVHASERVEAQVRDLTRILLDRAK